jgi:hypothetical protein
MKKDVGWLAVAILIGVGLVILSRHFGPYLSCFMLGLGVVSLIAVVLNPRSRQKPRGPSGSDNP